MGPFTKYVMLFLPIFDPPPQTPCDSLNYPPFKLNYSNQKYPLVNIRHNYATYAVYYAQNVNVTITI